MDAPCCWDWVANLSIWPDGSAPTALASLLFRPSGATNHWKLEWIATLGPFFAHMHPLSSHSFYSPIFSLLLLSSLTLPTSAFQSVHRSLTCKLPAIHAQFLSRMYAHSFQGRMRLKVSWGMASSSEIILQFHSLILMYFTIDSLHSEMGRICSFEWLTWL